MHFTTQVTFNKCPRIICTFSLYLYIPRIFYLEKSTSGHAHTFNTRIQVHLPTIQIEVMDFGLRLSGDSYDLRYKGTT